MKRGIRDYAHVIIEYNDGAAIDTHVATMTCCNGSDVRMMYRVLTNQVHLE